MESELLELPLPDRIRHARKRAGFTSQEALGSALGTTRIHVNAWETGRNAPSMQYAVKLAAVLGGTPDDFQDGDGPRRRDEDLVRQLAGQMEGIAAALHEIRELLAQIRTAVVPPSPE